MAQAAAGHLRLAAIHEETASLLEELGSPTDAERHRRRAAESRRAAELDRARA